MKQKKLPGTFRGLFLPKANTLYPETSALKGGLAVVADPSANISITLPQSAQDRRKGQRGWGRPATRCSVCPAWPNAEDKLVQSKHPRFPHSSQAVRKGNHATGTLCPKASRNCPGDVRCLVSVVIRSVNVSGAETGRLTNQTARFKHADFGILRRPMVKLYTPTRKGCPKTSDKMSL